MTSLPPVFRLAAALAAALAATACRRSPRPPVPSVVLVTFGNVPGDAFESADATPSFAHLAGNPGVQRRAAPPTPEARDRLLSAIPALRRSGYATAAFLADPALVPAAAAFATSAVPGRVAATVILAPSPFESMPGESVRRGDTVVDAALAWLASQAGLPPPPTTHTRNARTGTAPADKAKDAAKPSVPARLRAPLFLWIHLADPIFHDSPRHIRVSGPASAALPEAEVAFLDMQLARIASFLSEHGLADRIALAAVCIEGAPSDPADAASGAWRRRPLPGAYPASAASILPPPPDAPAPEAPAHPSTADGLAFRLLHPRASDTNLVADCAAWRDANPADAQAWGWLGVAQGRAGDAGGAIDSHAKALGLAPGSPFRMANLGLAHLASGHVAQAIDQLENAYLAAPDNVRHRNVLAAVLLRTGLGLAAQGADAEALQCLSRVVYLQPNNPQGLVALGRLHAKMHRPDLARTCFQKALSAHPRLRAAIEGLRALDAPPAADPAPPSD